MLYFNIHDKILLALRGADQSYEDYFKKRLGYFLIKDKITTIPTITVNFVNAIRYKGRIKYIGNNMPYDSSYFYYTDKGGYKLGFDIKSNRIAITCQRGINRLDCFYIVENMLRDLITKSGAVFLHASGVTYKNAAVIFPAWGGTGKTNILIQFLFADASFLGDDMVVIDKDGNVYPYPKPLNLLYYNFDEYKDFLLDKASLKTKIIYRHLNAMRKIDSVLQKRLKNDNLLIKIDRFFLKRVADRCNEHIELNEIFPDAKIARSTHLQFVLFLTRTAGKVFIIKKIKPDLLAKKMTICSKWERDYLSDLSLPYLFAYPEKERIIREMMGGEREIIKDCFGKVKGVYSVEAGLDLSPVDIYFKLTRFIDKVNS